MDNTGLLPRRNPFLLDWRFLPPWALRLKDALRWQANRLGGAGNCASAIGRAWFATIRAGSVEDVKRAGILFVHVPRTAGTSLCRVLYGRSVPHCSAGFWRSLGDPELAALPSFSLVRDPVERAVSAYRFLRGGGTRLVASSRYDPARLQGCPSFEVFMRRLAAHRHHLRAYDVLRPQVEFVCDAAGTVIVDRLFPFEDLRGEAQALREWLGVCSIPACNESAAEPVEVTRVARSIVEALYAEDLRLHRSLLAQTANPPLRRAA